MVLTNETPKLSKLPFQTTSVVFAFCLFQLFFSERIPENNGLGWDGWTYAKWVRDLYGEVWLRGLDTYQVQRFLPSAIVHFGIRIFGLPLSDENIVRGFLFLNTFWLTGVGYLWGAIARRMRFSSLMVWLGLFALIANYGVGYMAFFNPVLTDTSALFAGALQFYLFLQKKELALLATSLVAAFAWPTALVSGLVLFVSSNLSTEWNPRFKAHAIAVTGLLGAFLVYRYLRSWPPFAHSLSSAIYFSTIVIQACLYAWVFLSLISWKDGIRNLFSWRPVVAVLIIFLVKQGQFYLSNHKESTLSYGAYLLATLYYAIREPFLAPVSHLVYFGPVLLLPFLYASTFLRSVSQERMGLAFAFFALMMLNCESRGGILYLPCFVAFSIKALEEVVWDRRKIAYFMAVTFLTSGLWLRISHLWVEHTAGTEGMREFPAQYYFMHFGPWMSREAYLIQVCILSAILVGFILVFRSDLLTKTFSKLGETHVNRS